MFASAIRWASLELGAVKWSKLFFHLLQTNYPKQAQFTQYSCLGGQMWSMGTCCFFQRYSSCFCLCPEELRRKVNCGLLLCITLCWRFDVHEKPWATTALVVQSVWNDETSTPRPIVQPRDNCVRKKAVRSMTTDVHLHAYPRRKRRASCTHLISILGWNIGEWWGKNWHTWKSSSNGRN